MRIGSTLLFGIALAGLMPAAAHPAAGPTARGRDLAAQVCSACHVIGSPQPFDPALDPPAPPFREIANRPGVTAAYLRRFVLHPHGGPRSAAVPMPDVMLLPEQADDLTAYILSLREPRRRD